ncbi:hypothetical protein NMY22_g4315 [Coprinellus aureogranulatus]|nr:hypothetical protein NMY22_g4315 [Coprinellus aureogranulatus]
MVSKSSGRLCRTLSARHRYFRRQKQVRGSLDGGGTENHAYTILDAVPSSASWNSRQKKHERIGRNRGRLRRYAHKPIHLVDAKRTQLNGQWRGDSEALLYLPHALCLIHFSSSSVLSKRALMIVWRLNRRDYNRTEAELDVSLPE